jgi:hypothetical protein
MSVDFYPARRYGGRVMGGRKDPAAVKLGRKGGEAKAANMTPEERSEAMRQLGIKRMKKLTAAQRTALGIQAVEAREKKRKRRKPAKP